MSSGKTSTIWVGNVNHKHLFKRCLKNTNKLLRSTRSWTGAKDRSCGRSSFSKNGCVSSSPKNALKSSDRERILNSRLRTLSNQVKPWEMKIKSSKKRWLPWKSQALKARSSLTRPSVTSQSETRNWSSKLNNFKLPMKNSLKRINSLSRLSTGSLSPSPRTRQSKLLQKLTSRLKPLAFRRV